MFVVDGYNAIRRVPRFAVVEARDGLRAGREALVTAILASGTLRAQPVVIIFDGNKDIDIRHNLRAPHPKLTLRFSRSPDNADQEILRFVGKGRATAATVITADQDLAFEARRLGGRAGELECFEAREASEEEEPASSIRKAERVSFRCRLLARSFRGRRELSAHR